MVREAAQATCGRSSRCSSRSWYVGLSADPMHFYGKMLLAMIDANGGVAPVGELWMHITDAPGQPHLGGAVGRHPQRAGGAGLSLIHISQGIVR